MESLLVPFDRMGRPCYQVDPPVTTVDTAEVREALWPHMPTQSWLTVGNEGKIRNARGWIGA